MIYWLGAFCLALALAAFGSAWSYRIKHDYEEAMHHELCCVGFIIAAAICFK